MYAMTVFPFVNFTLATFRFAELGFLGAIIKICEQTPFFCGQLSRSGDFDLVTFWSFFRRMDWFKVMESDGEELKDLVWRNEIPAVVGL